MLAALAVLLTQVTTVPGWEAQCTGLPVNVLAEKASSRQLSPHFGGAGVGVDIKLLEVKMNLSVCNAVQKAVSDTEQTCWGQDKAN